MSHFTRLKTKFQNLVYLEKALNKLNITHKKDFINTKFKNSDSINEKLVISQSNGYDIEFVWNGNEYELIVDMSFWSQSYPVENFVDQIAQKYAGEVIIGESDKLGFQPLSFSKGKDGSNTLVLERWDNS